MLSITIGDADFYDEKLGKFITVKGKTLQLEHSLVSVAKWESKWKKPFLSVKDKTREETLDYIKFMTITQNVDPLLYTLINNDQLKQISEYINDPMTATTFKKQEGKGVSRRVLTSEDIYYYMTALQIPFDPCQKWHFNRLLTLIRVCNDEQQPKKKMKKADIAHQRRGLNAARRARYHTRG